MTRVCATRRRFAPQFEVLEDRTLLSTCHVTRLGDVGAGMGFRGDLRYCINKVNAEPGPDAIDFHVTGTVFLTARLPMLGTDIDIDGPGAELLTIDAEEKDRVFFVLTGANVEIEGITLTGGRADHGGAIHNRGSLSLENCLISGNLATKQFGGGIYNEGDLNILNCSVLANTIGGLAPRGGGIYNAGTMTINRSSISDNFMGGLFSSNVHGVGIFNKGTATIIHTTIENNRGNIPGVQSIEGIGGGITNTGQLVVDSSLISRNTITGDLIVDGGGIANVGGTATVVNSTIAGNGALALADGPGGGQALGGGICNCSHGGPAGTLIVIHSTIANNRAVGLKPQSTAIGGGIVNSSESSLSMRDTIVAGNTAEDAGFDFLGALASSGYNLIADSDGGSGYSDTDLLDMDPMLGSLQDNGGPTLTMALLPGSPAIDAGDPDPVDPPEFDQRGPGFPRIVNGRIDIGAFEAQSTGAPATARLARLGHAELSILALATADLNPLD